MSLFSHKQGYERTLNISNELVNTVAEQWKNCLQCRIL